MHKAGVEWGLCWDGIGNTVESRQQHCNSAPQVTGSQNPMLKSWGDSSHLPLSSSLTASLVWSAAAAHGPWDWALGEELPTELLEPDLLPLTTWHTRYKRQEEEHACFHWQAYRASWSEGSHRFCWHSRKQTDELGYWGLFCLFFCCCFPEVRALNKTDHSEMQFYNNPKRRLN